MKRYIIPLLALLLLSACGPAPAPTMNAVDIQNTAVANAWLSITQTQAAMPTATMTLTPVPTATATSTLEPILFPTIPPLQPTVPAGSPTANPCLDVAPKKPKGTTVNVKFINKAESPLTLHFGMNYANAQGECGVYQFDFGRIEQKVVTVLAGCYWAYAYVNGQKPSNSQNTQDLCVTDPAREPDIWIGAETIGFH